jgi:hypothetical protein
VTFPIEGKCPVCNEFPCTNIKVCWRVIELEKDLAAAVEVLQEVHQWAATFQYSSVVPRYKGGSSDKIYDKISALLARLEVK